MNLFKVLVGLVFNLYLTVKGFFLKREVIYYSKILDLKLRLKLDHLIDYLIYTNDVFQPELIRAIDQMIEKNGCKTFIDIGSHIGQMSLYVAKKNPGIKVLSIEPNPQSYNRQQANALLNSAAITIENLALGTQPGPCDFYGPKSRNLKEYLKFNDGKYASSKGTRWYFQSECITLNALAERYRFNEPVLVKMDVEGDELAIIKGGVDFLGTHDVILVTELLITEYPSQCSEICHILSELSFDIYDIYLRKINKNEALKANGDYIFMRP